MTLTARKNKEVYVHIQLSFSSKAAGKYVCREISYESRRNFFLF